MLPRSLYIHVPFCTRRCSYCDFAVQATSAAPVAEWLDAVTRELRLLALDQGWDRALPLDTLYLGGGTPSLLGCGAMAELAVGLREHASWDAEAVEWTCEANPESFTPELAHDWRAAGVNRLSLGAQSFQEPVLRWMGRVHGPAGPGRAMAAARAAGFENVSVDLIFGVPSRLDRDWRADLEGALALEPEHVSLYGLTAEAATPLGRWVREGRETLADEDRYAEEYLLAHEVLTGAGFEHYEVSNFGKPGLRSRHNFVYWTGAPYAALGPGAHAFYPPTRRWNLREWPGYRDALLSGRLPVDGEERVSEEDAALERVWLGLRTDLGFPLEDASEVQRDLAGLWVARGWAEVGEGRIRLTAEGWLLLDRIAVDFAAAAEPAHTVGGRTSD
jgi:oxygen-independent coproporphyrinogen-3 oxidase